MNGKAASIYNHKLDTALIFLKLLHGVLIRILRSTVSSASAMQSALYRPHKERNINEWVMEGSEVRSVIIRICESHQSSIYH